ncbi:hypothetical protein [Streptomyces sp. SS8]
MLADRWGGCPDAGEPSGGTGGNGPGGKTVWFELLWGEPPPPSDFAPAA